MPAARSSVVLVVEDHDDVREALVMLLHHKGFLAVGACDGAEGLELLRQGLEPCLILLDLMMPVKTGWEFRAEQLQEPKWAAIPTVVLSATEDRRELEGIAAALPKPLDFDALFRVVSQYAEPRK